MTYKFDLSISANLNSKVVEDIIRTVVEEQTGKKVASLEMKFRTVTKGIGPNESNEKVFDGCNVFFINEQSTTKTSVNNGFIPDKYE